MQTKVGQEAEIQALHKGNQEGYEQAFNIQFNNDSED